MKILNLYSGIGGNRKLWGQDHDITAVELNPQIAKIYQDLFPNDKVIVADAHQYLLEHFKEFEFIWSSPPCPTHSRLNTMLNKQGVNWYPDMTLWQEIIFLKKWFYGKFCVENVITYYEPLIKPTESDNHYFWTNFHISSWKNTRRGIESKFQRERESRLGFELDKFNIDSELRHKIINNCVEPELGLHILNESKCEVQPELFMTKEAR